VGDQIVPNVSDQAQRASQHRYRCYRCGGQVSDVSRWKFLTSSTTASSAGYEAIRKRWATAKSTTAATGRHFACRNRTKGHSLSISSVRRAFVDIAGAVRCSTFDRATRRRVIPNPGPIRPERHHRSLSYRMVLPIALWFSAVATNGSGTPARTRFVAQL
jgi:hypothetical protein